MKTNLRIVRSLSLLGLAAPLIAVSAHAQTDITKFGEGALVHNSSGDYNSAFGVNTLRQNTTGSGNTGLGRGAMYKNTAGNNNTAVGFGAMYYNTASGNTATGTDALGSVTGGFSNTAMGERALFANEVGDANVAVGAKAMEDCLNCFDNVAVGYRASTGDFDDENVAIGSDTYAGGGYRNIAIGFDAYAGGGNNNTSVGAKAFRFCDSLPCSNTSTFGSGAFVTSSNTVRIGNVAVTQIGGVVPWSNVSDGRYKTNVKQNVPGLAFITKLKPVTFNWKLSSLNEADGMEEFASDPVFGAEKEAKAKKLFTGFIAQDVEAAAEACGFDFSGVQKPANERSRYHLSYAEFVVPLVKAVQEQQKGIDAQRKEIEELRETVRGLTSDGRSRDHRLGQGKGDAASRYSGLVSDSWGGLMTLVSAMLVTLHLKRRRSA